jgi:hypothetical protein
MLSIISLLVTCMELYINATACSCENTEKEPQLQHLAITSGKGPCEQRVKDDNRLIEVPDENSLQVAFRAAG